MTIICDFDNALFDTRRFLSQLGKEWRACGVPQGLFLRCYRSVRRKGLYSPGRHIVALGPAAVKNRAALLAGVRRVQEGSYRFLFKDVVPCLKQWKRKGYRLVLLTYGHRAFQKEKLRKSDLAPLFERVIVTSHPFKVAMVRRLVGWGGDVVLIDDNLEALRQLKKKVPRLKPIHIERYRPLRSIVTEGDICSVANLFQVDRVLTQTYTERRKRVATARADTAEKSIGRRRPRSRTAKQASSVLSGRRSI